MSQIQNIYNLKNVSDLTQKRREFFSTLRLQQKLNRQYEQAMIGRAQSERLGITPVPEASRSLEDERRDDILQQQIAVGHLQSIMKDEEAYKAIQSLSVGEIYAMNSYWGQLASLLVGQTNISADFFKRVLGRFLQALELSGGIAIPIPIRETTIAQMPADLLDVWIKWSQRAIDPATNKPYDLATLIKLTADILGRSVDNVAQEVKMEQTAMEGESEATPMDVAESYPQVYPMPAVPSAKMTGKKRRPMEPMETDAAKKRRIQEEKQGIKRKMKYELETELGPDAKIGRKDGTDTIVKPQAPPLIDIGVKRQVPYEVGTELGPSPKARRKGEKPVEPRGQKRMMRYSLGTELGPEAKARRIQEEAYVDAAKSPIVAAARAQAAAELQARTTARANALRGRPARGPRARLTPIDTAVGNELGDFMADIPTMTGPQAPVSALESARAQARRDIQRREQLRIGQLMNQGAGLYTSQVPTAQLGVDPFTYTESTVGGGKVRHSKMTNMVRNKHGKIIGKVGAGIPPTPVSERYREFGKYMLHTPSLRKGMINIKYRSRMAIPGVPQMYVSQDFIDMIQSLLDNGVWDKSVYNKLSQEEQEYFMKLARRCEFDTTCGMGIKLTKQEQEEIRRFELLKGTVMAGNNSPEVLKELRHAVIRLVNDGRLPKNSGHDLLVEMACLS